LATATVTSVAADERSARSIERVGFDRFVFDAPTRSRSDGSCLQRGVDVSGTALEVGSIPWPAMPIEWLALSPRRGENLLEIDTEDDDQAIVDPDLAERFIIDTDLDDLTEVLNESTVNWILQTDAEVGPLYLVLDGPDPDEDHVSTIYIARVDRGDGSIDMRELAVEVRNVLGRFDRQ
jgi:hypothetical protein